MAHSLPPLAFLGAGSMGGALLRGVLASGIPVQGGVTAVNRSTASAAALAELPGTTSLATATTADANVTAAAGAGLIVVGVKPVMVPALLQEIAGAVPPDAVVVSIAAGIPARTFEAILGADAKVVRAMPNTPVAIGQGVTGIAPGSAADADDVALVRRLFETVGTVVEVEESEIDALSAISGSGPAYVYFLIEEFTAAAERLGFSSAQARLLVEQTFAGATALLDASDDGPAELRRQVTSPHGTTERGVAVLQDAGLAEIFTRTIQAARDRAVELGAGG